MCEEHLQLVTAHIVSRLPSETSRASKLMILASPLFATWHRPYLALVEESVLPNYTILADNCAASPRRLCSIHRQNLSILAIGNLSSCSRQFSLAILGLGFESRSSAHCDCTNDSDHLANWRSHYTQPTVLIQISNIGYHSISP